MNKPRILLAEDDPTTLNALCSVLSDEGYVVVSVTDGAAALQELARDRFALLVTDLNMPNVSGSEVLERVRRGGGQMPVIIITADGEAIARMQANAMGASAYISKPVNLDDFLERVTRCLQSSPTLHDC